MKTQFKIVKKEKMIRNFSKPNSVFADWHLESQKALNEAFEKDKAFLKTPKFIKDPDDLDKTHKVLKKYFFDLKNQFNDLSGLAPSRLNHDISWLVFSDAC